MSYSIDWTPGSGKAPVVVDPQSKNDTDTSFVLYGKGTPNYGENIQENLLRHLENFCAPSSPFKPTKGQLWFDSASNTIKVFNGASFTPVSPITAGPVAPTSPGLGFLWYDSTIQNFKFWNGSSWVIMPNDAIIGTKLSTAGGTMTGSLILAGDPTGLYEAATKKYVDDRFSGIVIGTYDLAGSVLGKAGNNVSLMRFVAPRSFVLKAGLPSSVAKSNTAPGANTIYSIKKNNNQIGTINWTTGSNNGSFSFAADVQFVLGDVLTVTSPATADNNHTDIEWTFVANLA